MIPLEAPLLADVVGGELLAESAGRVTGVATDAAAVRPGDLFAPLAASRGTERAAGDVLAGAAAGATAWLCPADEVEALLGHGAPAAGCIAVDDVDDALLGLAAWVRDEVDPQVVALVGDPGGAAEVRRLAAAAVGAARVTVAGPAQPGDPVGMARTLCLLTPGAEVLICQVAADELPAAAAVLRPDVVAVAGGADPLGDALLRAAADLLAAAGEGAAVVLDGQDPGAAALAGTAPGAVVTARGPRAVALAVAAALDVDPAVAEAGMGGAA